MTRRNPDREPGLPMVLAQPGLAMADLHARNVELVQLRVAARLTPLLDQHDASALPLFIAADEPPLL